MTGRAARGGIAACCALLACAGCGFKGPLYLPERNTTVVTHAAQAAQDASPPAQTQATGATQPSSTQKEAKTSPTPAQSPSSPQSQSPPQSPSSPAPPQQ